jgi:glycosyltransferase involved in cell wall biosynthesis
MKKKSVLIFRKSMLPYSETFIADQGRFLESYRPVFTGFRNNLTGKQMLKDSNCLVLEDYVQSLQLAKKLYRLGMFNKQWLHEISGFSPSIIHAHFLNDGFDAMKLSNKLDIPLITTVHGHDITKRERKSFFSISRHEFFVKTSKIIAVSDYIYERALLAGCPEHKLVKHSIGIDLEKFSGQVKEAEEPELLFVGRLVEKKGCIYLLQALSVLKNKYPQIRLTIVGEGPLRSKLVSMTENMKLNVDFVGKESANQIRDRLSKAWMFVAPSITAENGDAEGLGMVFLEAQALKTPVVSFKSGGVVEAVENEVTGLLSEEKDVNGLVESIRFFLDNPGARKEYGERGRQRVESLFDIRKQCVILENMYDSVK